MFMQPFETRRVLRHATTWLWRTMRPCLAIGIALLFLQEQGPAQDLLLFPEEPDDVVVDEEDPMGNLNVKSPTLGGKQFWTDQRHRGGWRIQQNVITRHCRLLNDSNRRLAWGSFEACEAALEKHIAAGDVSTSRAHAVIVLHGLGRSRSAMQPLCNYLDQHGNCTTINVSYASTRDTVRHHAAALNAILLHLDPDIKEVSFVAHSLGNIVIRHYLQDRSRALPNERGQPRIHRMVMLGPPNNGTALAERFKNNPLFRALWGKSGVELAENFAELEKSLAIPACEFGIIAGGKESGESANPLLDGANDFVVTVDETRLPGAKDFKIVPVLHSFLMNDQRVQQDVVSFLNEGQFVTE